MPDRFAELVRQRALLQQHLAWLDREIENASPKSAPTPRHGLSPTATASPTLVAPNAEVEIGTGPEEILEQYRVSPVTMKQDVRKGCLLYFTAAFVLLGVIVAILFFALRSK